MAKLCMGCMNPLPEGTTVCGVCGFDPEKDKNPQQCLPIATALQGHYIVGRCMGACSDHLLYLAYDRQMREPCFIQEFFPGGLCRRDTIGGVQPLEGCDRVFQDYADRFRGTMRTLARMRELPALVPVYDIFEENGTVYAASDYCQGMTLTRKIKLSGGRVPWPEVRALFMPLLATLAQLNEAGIYHLAVSPDNIIIGADGKARLRNFSIPAAHQTGTDLTPDLKSGFAAPEQYQAEAMVDSYTDVYGIAATLFRTVTGNELPAGDNRAKNSDDLFMSAEVAQELTQPVCAALFNALLVPCESRTATVAALRDQLATTPNVAALVTEAERDMGMQEEEEKPASNRWLVMLAVFGGCLLALLLIVWILWPKSGGDADEGDKQPTTSSTDEGDEPATTTSTEIPDYGDRTAQVPNVLDSNYYDLRDSNNLGGKMRLVLADMKMDDSEAGTILSQEPEAGTEAKMGSEIRVVISLGRKDENVKVPDVSGWKQEHAKAYLEALGFRVEIEKIEAPNREKGEVVESDPKKNSTKRLGDTITLRVNSKAPTTTTTTTTTTTSTTTTTTTAAPTQPTEPQPTGDVNVDTPTDPTAAPTDPAPVVDPTATP